MSFITLIGACLVFLIGLSLSAFFSGNETGFYRLSFVRLNIDAQSGDRVTQKLLWFARNPSYFVATTLIGNNVANYLTTLSIGIATMTIIQSDSGWIEIAGTLLLAPVIFIFGELVPKNLYFRSPHRLLRRDAYWFSMFYRLFLPVSFPLIWIAKLFESLKGTSDRQIDLVLGRKRLVQVLDQGRQEGLLTDIQSRLIDGLMHTASQPVIDSLIPARWILGLEETASPQEVLDYARRYGLTSVTLKREGSTDDWYGYVRVLEVTLDQSSLTKKIRTMPEINASDSKLNALRQLKSFGERFGVVKDSQTVLGIVSEHGLVEQMLQPTRTLGVRQK
jgi:putative hemolysin